VLHASPPKPKSSKNAAKMPETCCTLPDADKKTPPKKTRKTVVEFNAAHQIQERPAQSKSKMGFSGEGNEILLAGE
jgi:hypothetical protein